MPARDIVVIGASMGGVEALSTLSPQLRADLPAAVFVVQHTSAESPGLLAGILDRRGALPAVAAEDGMAIERGRIVVAPPDRHLMLTAEGTRVGFGPRENRSRPSIDVLFRTAAVNYRSRVVGVVLTGLLSDGAAGLAAVKRCGGLAVVQDPEDAAHPEMPRRALTAAEADHVVPLAEMGVLLGRLAATPAPEPPPVPEDLSLEARLTERAMQTPDWKDLPGSPTTYACPECGGSLREVGNDRPRRYRCHIGHGFTDEALLQGQDHAVEEALWVALRTLKERAAMLETMAGDERARGRPQTAASYEERARESRTHVDVLQRLLARLL